MPARVRALVVVLSSFALLALALALVLTWQIVHVRQDILDARAACPCCPEDEELP